MALPRFLARIPRLPQKKAGFTQVVVVVSVIIFLLGSSAVAAYYFPNNPLVKTGKKILASLPLPFWSSNPPSTEANTASPSPMVTPESKQSDSLTVPPALLEQDTADLRSPVPILGSNLSLDTNTASSVIYSIMAGTGIAVSAGQHPTITNTGVLSVGGRSGTVYIDENGLKFDGNKLYNADKGSSQNIFKTIKVDGEVDVKADSNNTDLYLVAGTGMEIDTNDTEKTITFNGKAGWIDDGSVVRTLTDTDKVGVGTLNPTSLFSVGGSSEFQVNSTGNIVKINNVAYSFPSSQGSTSSLLQNDGSGGLTWATIGASAITPDSLDFSEFKDMMTLDGATTIAQAGFNFAFSGSGNVGVGTTTPSYKLDIAGTGRFTGNLSLDSLASGSTDTVVTHSSGTLQTRTIDSRAWGSTLTDGSGAASYVARWSDANTLSTGVLYDNGTNVGIGTTDPGALLGIGSSAQFKVNSSGAISAATGITSSGTITFSDLGSGLVKSTSGVLSVASSGTDYQTPLSFTNGLTLSSNTVSLGGTLTGNTTLANGGFNFNITGSGNVGIGTTAPVSALNVAGTTSISWGYQSGSGLVTIGTRGTGGSLFINTPSFSSDYPSGLAIDGAYGSNLSTVNIKALGTYAGSQSSNLVFYTSNNTSLVEGLRIKADGKVGIGGVTNPVATFEVGGSTGITWSAGGGSSYGLANIGTSGSGGSLFVQTPSLNSVWSSGLGIDGTYGSNTSTINIKAYSVNHSLYSSNLAFFSSIAGVMTEGLRLSNTGNVGIGTTSPGTKLDVNGTFRVQNSSAGTNTQLSWSGATWLLNSASATLTLNGTEFDHNGTGIIQNSAEKITKGGAYLDLEQNGVGNTILSNNSYPITFLTSGSERLRMAANGNVGIGTIAPAQLFHVQRSGAGVVARFTDSDGSCDIDPITTSMSCSSDMRLKKDITTIPNALEKVEALRGVNYKWKTQADDTLRIGFVAQEVEPIVPELVGTDEYGMKSVRYTNFAPLLVNAIKELDEKKLNREDLGLFLNTKKETAPTPSPTSTPSATPTLSPTPSDDPSLFESLLTRLKEAIFGTAAVFQKTVAFLGEVTFGNRVIFADKDMAGFAVISKDKQEVTITFQKPYINKPVVNLTNDGHTTPAFVKNVSPQSFTIQIPAPAAQDLAFNWIAISHKDPQTTRSSEEHIVSPIAETTPTPTQPPSVSGAKEFVTPTPSVETQKHEEASGSASLQSTNTDSPKAPSNTPTPTLSQANSTASESASIR